MAWRRRRAPLVAVAASALVLLTVAAAVLLATTADAQQLVRELGRLIPVPVSQVYNIAADANFVFLPNRSAPGGLLKMRVSDMDVSSIQFLSGEDNAEAVLLFGDTAIVTLNSRPGRVISINTTTMTRITATNLTFDDAIISVTDGGSYIYTSCSSAPPRVTKLSRNLDVIATISLAPVGLSMRTMVIDTATNALLGCTTEVPARCVQIMLASFAMAQILTLQVNEDNANAMAIDNSGYVLIALTTDRIVQLRTSNLARIGQLQLTAFDNSPMAIVIDSDPARTLAYVFSNANPMRAASVYTNNMTLAGSNAAATGVENGIYRGGAVAIGGRVYSVSRLPMAYLVTWMRAGDPAATAAATTTTTPAAPMLRRVDAVQLQSNDGPTYNTAAEGGFMYLPYAGAPGKLTKVRLSDMTRVDGVTLLPEDAQSYAVVVVDEIAYVTLALSPPALVRVFTANMTRGGKLVFDNTDGIGRVTLTDGAFLYTSCSTNPPRLVKTSIATFQRAGATLPVSALTGGMRAMVVDPGRQWLYGCSDATPSRCCQIRLLDFSVGTSVDLNIAEGNANAMVHTGAASGGWILVAVETSPGRIVKLATNPLARIGFLLLDAGEDRPTSLALDLSELFVYGVLNQSPIRVVTVRIDGSSTTMTRILVESGLAGEAGADVQSAVGVGGDVFVATTGSQPFVVKFSANQVAPAPTTTTTTTIPPTTAVTMSSTTATMMTTTTATTSRVTTTATTTQPSAASTSTAASTMTTTSSTTTATPTTPPAPAPAPAPTTSSTTTATSTGTPATTNNVSSTAAASPPPPPPPPRPASTMIVLPVPAVEPVLDFAVVSSVVSGVGFVAVQQARFQSAKQMANCGNEQGLEDDMSRLSNPFGTTFGDGIMRSQRGAAFSNIYIILLFAVLMLLVALGLSRYLECSFRDAALRARLPGVLVLPLSILITGTSEAATSLFGFGALLSDKSLAVFACVTIVVGPTLLSLLVSVKATSNAHLVTTTEASSQSATTTTTTAAATPSPVGGAPHVIAADGNIDDGDDETRCGARTIRRLRELVVYLVQPTECWVDRDRSSIDASRAGTESLDRGDFCVKYGVVFEDYSRPMFAVFDLGVSIVLGATAGSSIGPQSRDSCLAAFGCAAACAVGHLAYLGYCRPCLSRLQQVYQTFASTITLIAVVLALLLYLAVDLGSAFTVVDWLQSAVSIVTSVLQVTGAVVTLAKMMRAWHATRAAGSRTRAFSLAGGGTLMDATTFREDDGGVAGGDGSQPLLDAHRNRNRAAAASLPPSSISALLGDADDDAMDGERQVERARAGTGTRAGADGGDDGDADGAAAAEGAGYTLDELYGLDDGDEDEVDNPRAHVPPPPPSSSPRAAAAAHLGLLGDDEWGDRGAAPPPGDGLGDVSDSLRRLL